MELGALGPFGPLAAVVLLVFGAVSATVRVALAIGGLRSLFGPASRRERLVLAVLQLTVALSSMVAGADGWLALPGVRTVNGLQLVLGLALLVASLRRPALAR